jgi:hypothetical protein
MQPTKGKRYPLNMRTTKELREKLERAAAKSGRSLVGEVEYRLERSFDRDEVVKLVSETWLERARVFETRPRKGKEGKR